MATVIERTQKQVRLPRFVIEEGGPYKRNIAKWNKDKKTFEYTEVEEEASYIVKCPKKHSKHTHSIRVRTKEELIRLVGDPELVEIVDQDEGDVVGVARQPIKTKGASK